MSTEAARVGAVCADSLPFSQSGTAAQARALRAAGIEAMWGYLGVITTQRLGYILDAGMAFMPVTLAGRYGPDPALAQLRYLGITPDVTVTLDVEGLDAFRREPVSFSKILNYWADTIAAAGWMPGGYFGSPQPFTSDELWALHFKRYWRGQGSIRDRHNALAEPTKCGWYATQVYPSVVRGGVLVDLEMIGQDYLRRVPNWMVA